MVHKVLRTFYRMVQDHMSPLISLANA